MPQFDLLDELMTSNPNESATNGVLALLRMETRSEFKTLKSDFGRLEGSVELIARQLVQLIARVDQIAANLDRTSDKVDQIAQKIGA